MKNTKADFTLEMDALTLQFLHNNSKFQRQISAPQTIYLKKKIDFDTVEIISSSLSKLVCIKLITSNCSKH